MAAADQAARAIVANEYTPLLAPDAAPPLDSESSDVTLFNGSGSDAGASDAGPGGHDNHEGGEKPLRVWQVLFLCYIRLVEPIAFFSIFPYINKMVQENGNLADADVGFYSGLIESLFSLTQMVVMLAWGKAADRFGRRPVLISSLVGMAAATALFGTARTIAQMILFRCLAGLFAGTVVTVRTMISEHSTADTQARAFSWFAFAGNLGILVGPLIGGVLVDPAEQYPGLFGRNHFLRDYPYALPSFAAGLVVLSAGLVCAVFVEETLPPMKKKKKTKGTTVAIAAANGDNGDNDNDDDGETGIVKPANGNHPAAAEEEEAELSIPQLVRQPGVGLVLYTYSHVMLLAFAYTAIAPVFWYTPVPLGGYAFTPLQISLLLALNGLAQAVWVLFVFPALHRVSGTNGVLRICATFYPVFFLLMPFSNLLLRVGTPGAVTAFWVLTPTALVLGCGVSMSFTAVQLALNDVSPGPRVLGTLNALALALTSGVRSFAPALFAGLFAVGARTQWVWGYAIWLLMAALAAGFTVVSRRMPDYDELRRRRERGEVVE